MDREIEKNRDKFRCLRYYKGAMTEVILYTIFCTVKNNHSFKINNCEYKPFPKEDAQCLPTNQANPEPCFQIKLWACLL